MKILAIIDKFKGTLSSKTLGKITKDSLSMKGHDVDYYCISDGGDGFLDSIYNNKMVKKYVNVLDALGNKKQVYYYVDNNNVYIEVAKIIGRNKDNKYDIYNASTYGVGQVIKHAIKNNGKNFFIGLGGSITNDGGKGMLEALGYKFVDNKVINNSNISFKDYKFIIVSDVSSPLLGDNGATYMFSKQKGAKEIDLPILEKKMNEYSNIITSYLNKDFTYYEGSGAAGGLGFAFLSILNGTYIKGINFVLDHLNIDKIIDKYDLIITGEGKIDEQSLNGKIVFEITKRYNKETIIVCAINECDSKTHKIYSIVNNITDIDNSMKHPRKYYKQLIESIKIES